MVSPYDTASTPPSNGTVTSDAAAEAIKPSAATLRALVLAAVSNSGPHGVTRQEIEERTQLEGNTVRPRVKELLAAGLVVETDRVRDTRSGRAAFVLVAKEFA
ncbi:MAG: MarR family transcriptional regulator [Deltaproteobacteria bacterium]|nr:MarR family transcriptional regulator [Deltaproteobacteria bacterium]